MLVFSNSITRGGVPGGEQYYDIIHWHLEGPEYKTHHSNTTSIQTIKINVIDPFGNSLDFNNYDTEVCLGIRKVTEA